MSPRQGGDVMAQYNMDRAKAFNHELAEYAKAYKNAANGATRDAIEKHIDRLTDEYMREVMGLPAR
jgi:hypothetical protein